MLSELVEAGVLAKSGMLVVVEEEDNVDGREEDFDSWRFLKVLASEASFVLSRRAGIATLSSLKYLKSGGGVFEDAFCSSSITACNIDDIEAAGWYVHDISCSAEARHSR